MYTLRINYSGGSHKIYNSIDRIEYKTFLETIKISGDEILNHTFTLGHDINLFSRNQKILIPRQGVVGIFASKEGY
jgi:hypothetical protein